MSFLEATLHCVDLGARAGMPPHWRAHADKLTVDAFEPDEDALDKGYRQLGNVRWFPVGLAGVSDNLPFHITSTASGSSLYPPNAEVLGNYSPERYWRVSEVRRLPFHRFSDFIREYERPPPEVIKLDTQGSELDILRSLEPEHWSRMIAVETEVEFIDLYEGQPLFRDIDAFMAEQGFRLMDLRTHRSYRLQGGLRGGYLRSVFGLAEPRRDYSARLLAGDALYMRAHDRDCPQDRAMIAKTVLALCLYNFFDEAAALIAQAEKLGRLTATEAGTLRRDVVAAAPAPGPTERVGSPVRKLRSGLRLIGVRLARLLGLPSRRRGAAIAGWSTRIWPDQ